MKNKIIQLLLLICCLPALTGCIREEEYANDPVGNFEQLWKIIDEQYCFLEAKGIDWDAVHEKYRKLVVPTMSNDDLFDLLSQMLYTLKDGHVNLPPNALLSMMSGIRGMIGITGKTFFTRPIWAVPAAVTTQQPD